MDIADPKESTKGFAWIEKTYGRLDILVNNAGVTIKRARQRNYRLRTGRRSSALVTGSFLCAQHAANLMLPRGHGKDHQCYLHLRAFVGRYLRVAYSASKGGELQMTKTMAMEWASAA